MITLTKSLPGLIQSPDELQTQKKEYKRAEKASGQRAAGIQQKPRSGQRFVANSGMGL
jgi:hypothetical protein